MPPYRLYRRRTRVWYQAHPSITDASTEELMKQVWQDQCVVVKHIEMLEAAVTAGGTLTNEHHLSDSFVQLGIIGNAAALFQRVILLLGRLTRRQDAMGSQIDSLGDTACDVEGLKDSLDQVQSRLEAREAATSRQAAELDALRAKVEGLAADMPARVDMSAPNMSGSPVPPAPATTSPLILDRLNALEQRACAKPTTVTTKVVLRNVPPASVANMGPTLEQCGLAQYILASDVLPRTRNSSTSNNNSNNRNSVVLEFPSTVRRRVLAAAPALRNAFGITMVPYLTAYGMELRKERQATFSALMTEGCQPSWRDGVEIRYTRGLSGTQLYDFRGTLPPAAGGA